MKEIVISIRRAPYQSLAAFLILFFTLFLSSIMFISMSFLYGLLGYVETRPQVIVYFQTNTSENSIIKLRDRLMNSGKVLSIKYISKDDAYKIYKDLNKDNPLLLEMVTSDILPASLEIFAKKPVFLQELADFLKKQPGVDEVNFQKDILDRLLTLTNILRKTTITFFIFLFFLSILVLFTTILFKIALKKDEIELLRLLGASNYYIKKPFILEATLFGLSASIGSFLIILIFLLYLKPFLDSYLSGITNLTLSIFITQITVWPLNIAFLLLSFFLSLFFGVSIAVLSSLLATQKYLKI
ncbi:hypothetical protein A3C98_02145 [Candidatus Roizmanbacteria bacterium RIFCSPHIGHO2_02_FULL_37_15]|uniref:Cell division protein FtsX n=1 Tax=Candidatus Roizmanbacteria bacterium RIFCSPLOWO2_01_FULL_37_16 TaxID=1802058 RepID=A0A1F7IQ76_9BACT|nr:MAG: hypothetical protein A2859_04505 [Candidatus Roizmanbacteria bacterium RIFCSPHIGHO2_01_FULL_37_16b]OGK21195.1 MAG: hypothetical protein A3C98_02145 [Candidatus Roizmanbacteria bacterium RIFCSPHIGHO2_02_FULL_37_15]OGK32331.1 MAG: hypothetical protein A3F57_05390 [Candidatus Roizmanbacteria bacterium RIFCSPHIGHO2_12_FULL_36_11]OGK45518.1 MAG: hypothetical protein A3B40_00685 [Candidatus Roizmanbacteria bacterium RIFCSPLOWO2_01_FULL_37_16]OGK55722.1 MAG: hypothetical protein A3I50_02580 [C